MVQLVNTGLSQQLWDLAKQRLGNQAQQATIEAALSDGSDGKITPITQDDRRIFQSLFEQKAKRGYGDSWYYVTQNTGGSGPENLGYKYCDGEMLVPIGLNTCPNRGIEEGLHFYLINPLGTFDRNQFLALTNWLAELSHNPVFIKKISAEQQAQLLEIGFQPIENYPWHPLAPAEDDTQKGQILSISNVVQKYDGLIGKRKADMSKAKAKVSSELVTPLNAHEVVAVVEQFLSGTATGHLSKPSDYYPMIFNSPLGKNGVNYWAQLIKFDGIPAGFIAMEPISSVAIGLYANISLFRKNADRIEQRLGEQLIVHACWEITRANLANNSKFERLHMGGSETRGLFEFKDKFSPIDYEEGYWLVYPKN